MRLIHLPVLIVSWFLLAAWNTGLSNPTDTLSGSYFEEPGSEEVPFTPTPDQPGLDTEPVPQVLEGAAADPNYGPIMPTTGQPKGALTGRIVFTSAGHGWNWNGSAWVLDRPLLNMMVEDFGNIDQMSLFAYYCFNAGATVVPFRPIGNQTNEVVMDNDSPGVSYSGAWANSSSAVFFGQPGDAVPYRFSNEAAVESARATYVPNLPATGSYPVYTWVLHSDNRVNQLYRVNHTGGQSLVRVPHNLVGNGWVYLGTYHFNAGANAQLGAVIISNEADGTNLTGVVIADGIRFGNGMGDVNPGGGVSTYPREEEASRYWIERSMGVGQSSSIHANGNVGAPPRMAVEMNREKNGSRYQRVYAGFHSNAGGGRGVMALWNDNTKHPGTGTSNQFGLAQLLGTEINSDMVSLSSKLETPWFNRTSITYNHDPFAYGEINNATIADEFDATIVEVAFHDNDADARLMRDPKVRDWVARSTYQGLVRYFAQYGGINTVFLPEPPFNLAAKGSNDGVWLTWSAPVAQAGSGPAAGYVVYAGRDGYGFVEVLRVSGGLSTSATLTNVASDEDWYFRVAAYNPAGESMPSETAGCRRSSLPGNRVLFVNAFSRYDRTLNLRQTAGNRAYKPPGHDGNTGALERVLPGRVNAFNYVVPHGKAISAAGWAFDSCQSAAVGSRIALSNYTIVVWGCGNESVEEETFSAAEQKHVADYLAARGSLFVSGSDVGNDLGRLSGPTSGDRDFLAVSLRTVFTGDNSESYSLLPASGGLLEGYAPSSVDDGSRGIYWVPTPDVLAPGDGARATLTYSSGAPAAVQYDGSRGGGRVVVMGFPFEAITSESRRREYMAATLNFLTPVRIRAIGITQGHGLRLLITGAPGAYDVQLSRDTVQWEPVATVTLTNGAAEVTTGIPSGESAGFWRVRRR